MRLTRPRAKTDHEENLIPLINIVFLLLIFFMLAGRLAPSDPMALEPPHADVRQRAGTTQVLVSIGATGQISLGGEPLAPEALAEPLGATWSEDARVLQIKADAALDAADFIALLDRFRAAGAEEIELLTLPRGN